jgi:alpha-1,2-mannosyltransferase
VLVERWLTRDRVTAWLRVLAVTMAVVVVGWVTQARGGLDPAGHTLGTDFIAFWTAARFFDTGADPALAYNDVAHQAAQQALFPGADVGYTAFDYPPTYLLICAPLGLLPYFPALIAWLAVTGLAYWRVVRAWAAGAFPVTLGALAFPAVLINLGHGQNAFLTTALFGAGALWLPRRPFLAGLCFGLLTFKPHLGLLIPFGLLAARQWRAIAGAVLGAMALAGAATAAFGLKAWEGFFKVALMARGIVGGDLIHPGKIQSVFGAFRLWHVPAPLAYGVQGFVALAAAVAVVAVARRRGADRALGPVLIAASVVATPYILDYDLVLLAVPVAWLLSEALSTRFLPGEKLAMAAAYALPLVSRIAAIDAHAPIAPPVLIAFLAVVVRRAWVTEVRAPASAETLHPRSSPALFPSLLSGTVAACARPPKLLQPSS